MRNNRLYIFIVIAALLSMLYGSSCSSVKMSTALEEYNNGEYFKASQSFKKLYRQKDPKKERMAKGEVAWYLANCYDRMLSWAQASANYQNALRYGFETPTLKLKLAQTKHKEGRYKEAIALYNEYLEEYPDDILAINGLNGASKAEEWKLQASRYSIKRFPLVNSRRAEFSPAISGSKDDELYFTTSNDKVVGKENSNITGTKYFDIWVTKKDEKGIWQKPQSIGEDFNTPNDEGTPCFSPDGNSMYYTVAGGMEGMGMQPAIYVSRRSDASWGKGTKLAISNDTVFTYAHPAISPDGKHIYFVSDIPGGQGGMDIWRATLEGSSVGALENLGSEINTEGDEMFPTFSPDGLLYYSSNGKEGMGGLDIYSARLDEWGTWHISHLEPPINSNADDFGMTFMRETKEEQEGWFSSNRNSGKGYDNIYSFLLPSIKIKITGMVMDTDGEPIPEAIVRVVGRNGMNFKSVTKPDGTYEVNIDRSTEYVMMSGKMGYLNRKAQFTSDDEEEDADYEVDFYLPYIGVPIEVENVFYAYNQADVMEESYPALDELVAMLNDNPYTQIELSAHTDRVGSQNFNLDLSLRRAQSVCDYLISQGIDAERLVPVGYGKEQPKVVDEKMAEEYGFPVGQVLDEEFVESLDDEQKMYADQINRRTEFKVLTITLGIE